MAAFSEAVRELLAEEDPKKRKTKARLLVEQAYARALRGSARHLQILLDRAEGKPRQSLELTGGDGGPVSLKYANMPIEEVERRIEELLAECRR